MLTKGDLTQIKEIVKTETEPRFQAIDKQFARVDKRFDKIEKTLKSMQKEIRIIIRFFDSTIQDTRKRVGRIEDHLKLPPLET